MWSSTEGATRDTFHLLSALVTLPVALHAGRPFFASALGAVRAGRLDMDVPIFSGTETTPDRLTARARSPTRSTVRRATARTGAA